MSSAGLQSATDIITFLTSGWNSANTDGYTPEIIDALETPFQSLDFGAKDILYVKNEAETVKTGMYGLDYYHDVLCIIEVMTAELGTNKGGRAHFKKLIDEAMRIIKLNVRYAGYAQTIIASSRPRHVKERGIYLGRIEVKQLKINHG
jgi:hypothetical protein